jgi:hypothetical protein
MWTLGFKFIDAIFSLGIFAMLLPFLMLAFIFPVPAIQVYVEQGAKKALDAAATLFVLNFTMALAAGLIDASFFGFEGGMSNFDALINQNNRAALLAHLSVVNLGFLEMVVLFVILSALIEKSSTLVSDFIGGNEAENSISKGITGFFSSMAKKVGDISTKVVDRVGSSKG